MAVWLIFEVNMLQATERFPQAPGNRKIDKNAWILLNPDVSKFIKLGGESQEVTSFLTPLFLTLLFGFELNFWSLIQMQILFAFSNTF